MGNNASKFWIDASIKKEEHLSLNEELTIQNGYGRYLWKSCTKHAGHQNFIPVKEFKQSHLPLQFQNDKVLSMIIAISDLTVRIIARYTSERRPPGDKLYEIKGMDCRRFGSGTVINVVIVEDDCKGICTCAKCTECSCEPRFTAKVYVSTACHVVFDATEAAEAKAELFYDDEKDRKSVKILHGSHVLERSEAGDTCVFECVTHDEELAETLIKKLHFLRGIEENLGNISLHSPGSLSVVASHPHGASKHISIGEIKQLHVSNETRMESQTRHDLVKIDRDKAIFRLPLGQPSIQMIRDMVNKNDESEATGILVHVSFPDDFLKETLNIWQIEEPVKNTKKWLLEQSGFHRQDQDYILVIDLPDGGSVNMDDETLINHYWDDLTRSCNLRFEKVNNSSNYDFISTTVTTVNTNREYENVQMLNSHLVEVN